MKNCKTVGIVGLGLIGGSIARSLKHKGKDYRIIAWDKEESSLNQALSDRVIDKKISQDFKDFSDCDIIFLCVPVYAMKDVLVKLKHIVNSKCIITDVGSTKGDVEALIKEIGLECQYIGGHPLAGSELSGYQASKFNLFENAYYVMTCDDSTVKVDSSILRSIILEMGAIPLVMPSEDHDKVTAVISHVPHVVASLLVNLVSKMDGQEGYMKTLAAGGFKDITRIASSSADLWTGICLSNQQAVLNTIHEMVLTLNGFVQDLTHKNKTNIHTYFDNACKLRSTFSDLNKGILQKAYDISVDVEDKPGIIALIATALAKQNINIKNIGIINNRENDEGALEIRFENEESMKKGLETLIALGYEAKARK